MMISRVYYLFAYARLPAACCLPACLPAPTGICYRSQTVLIRFFRSFVVLRSESWFGSLAPDDCDLSPESLLACLLSACCLPA